MPMRCQASTRRSATSCGRVAAAVGRAPRRRAGGCRPRPRRRRPPSRAGAAARCRATARSGRPRAGAAAAGSAAQQCTTVSPSWAASTVARPAAATCGSRLGSRPKPDEVGSRPASTVGRRRLVDLEHDLARRGRGCRTAATCRRTPSASDSTRSRQAPSSTMTRSPRGSHTFAARVHGPTTWSLSGPVWPSKASASSSRSSRSSAAVRRRRGPGGRRAASRSAGGRRAARRAGRRCARSCRRPGPRAGSSGR